MDGGGWVESQKILAGQPSWIWLTKDGLETLELPYREWVPKAAGLPHLHAVNAVRLWLEGKDRQQGIMGMWISERRLRHEAHHEGVSYAIRDHLPDGEVHYEDTAVAIEVELTKKTQRRVIEIMTHLLRSYPVVRYFVTAETKGVVTGAHAALGSPSAIGIREGWER